MALVRLVLCAVVMMFCANRASGGGFMHVTFQLQGSMRTCFESTTPGGAGHTGYIIGASGTGQAYLFCDGDGVYSGLITVPLWVFTGQPGCTVPCQSGGTSCGFSPQAPMLILVKAKRDPVSFGWLFQFGPMFNTSGGSNVGLDVRFQWSNVCVQTSPRCTSVTGESPWLYSASISTTAAPMIYRDAGSENTGIVVYLGSSGFTPCDDGDGSGGGGVGTPPDLELKNIDEVLTPYVIDTGTMNKPTGEFGFEIPVSPLQFSGAPTITGTVAFIDGGWYRTSSVKFIADAMLIAVTGFAGVMGVLNELRKGGGED